MNINDGGQDYNEEKERKIVHEEVKYKNVSTNKLGNNHIMSNVSDNEIKIYHAQKDRLKAPADIIKAISVTISNKEAMTTN